jgi:FMN phosphatase YigB (HAD superfamily)
MIDDRQENCDGAMATGMQAILFTDLKGLKQSMKKLGINTKNN